MTAPGEEPDDEPASAADWFARMHGPGAARSAEAFEVWRRADPANDEDYRRLVSRWDQSKFLKQSATVRARDLSRVAVWHRRPAVRRAAMAGLVFLLAAGSLAVLFADRFAPSRGPQSTSLAWSTKVGEIRTIALADGSRVTLDSASTLQIAITPADRRAVADADAPR